MCRLMYTVLLFEFFKVLCLESRLNGPWVLHSSILDVDIIRHPSFHRRPDETQISVTERSTTGMF